MAEAINVEQKNLICNFRAPSLKEYDEWHVYKNYVKNEGLDVCRVTIGLCNAFMAGVNGVANVKSTEQVINLQMNNQFLYQVSKPRREPYSLSCVKQEYQRTFSSLLFEAYVLNKARDINREFSFRDFLELKHDSFRRIVRRLRQKGKIIANPLRTIPRFYILTERLKDYNLQQDTT